MLKDYIYEGENIKVKQYFTINLNTKITSEINSKGVDYAIQSLKRDMDKVLSVSHSNATTIKLKHEDLDNEIFHISYQDSNTMVIGASEELGFIYGIFYISKEILGVQPFWFWAGQVFQKKEEISFAAVEFTSKAAAIRFRGWFINDEVLIQHWTVDGSKEYPWIMAFEALLRCGGNMIVPGTDANSRLYRKTASDMGLYITHHHAEPLGAEMFARAYPKLKPSYKEHSELFQKLWKDGIEEQKNMKVVWNLGFRGQGDRPFWSDSPEYNTPESRGKLISDLIKLQLQYVSAEVKNPFCCINLYGEVMELYKDGYIDLPESVIRIWADNGYGKMVTRRRGNHNPRVPALPPEADFVNKHGIYYHVSFYDLQAANHITMQPNSVKFISTELEEAFKRGVKDYLIVNCSNIKPHTFYLDALRKLWSHGSLDEDQHIADYIRDYYGVTDIKLIEDIKGCYKAYSETTLKFGDHEDERAGDQFYNYTTRILAHYWLKGQRDVAAKDLLWATGDISYDEQMKWYWEKCTSGQDNFEALYTRCTEVYNSLSGYAKILFEESIYLHVKLHLYCLRGSIDFCNSYENFCKGDYEKAFYVMGSSSENYQNADIAMRETEKGIFKGFYANDCLCDVKYTTYMLEHLMFYIRNLGDGPHFYNWQRNYIYSEEDRRVVLITNFENHLTDKELYEAMKKNGKMA